MNRAWLEDVRMSACCSIETLEATYDICRSAIERGVLGDFVECGVYAGANVAVMAKALIEVGEDAWIRRVHLFDSFSGIPAAGPHDQKEVHAWGAGHSACSAQDVRLNFKRWGLPEWLFIFHGGLFEATIPATAISWLPTGPAIAVLRLDADLYESTRICMEYLYPLVSPGGWCIVDDFHLSGCREAVLERVVPAPIAWRKGAK